jgi:hypothetical protein
MIRQLRTRQRMDSLQNQARAGGISRGRIIYLCLVAGLGLFILNIFLGPYVFLRAEGMIMKEEHVVATLFESRTSKVLVKRGDLVEAGQPILQIESATVLREIADLSAQLANLTTRSAQLKAKALATTAVLPLAQQAADEISKEVAGLYDLKKKQLVRGGRLTQALNSSYEIRARLVTLKAEQEALSDEVAKIEQARDNAFATLDKVKEIYQNGTVTTRVAGIIGSKVPFPGEVYNVGDEILRIHTGQPFVLAYLPDSYLFPVSKSQWLSVRVGVHHVTGIVEELLPVAAALPPEFQNTFKPRSRSRIVRVRLPDDTSLAVNQKVALSRCFLPYCSWNPLMVPFAMLEAKQVSLKNTVHGVVKFACRNSELPALKAVLCSSPSAWLPLLARQGEDFARSQSRRFQFIRRKLEPMLRKAAQEPNSPNLAVAAPPPSP